MFSSKHTLRKTKLGYGKNMISSRRRLTTVLFSVLLIVCIALVTLSVACGRSISQFLIATPRLSPAPDTFPVANIVFHGGGGLGFINADGSDATTVSFRLPKFDLYASWGSPIIVGNETLIVTNALYPGREGNIFGTRAGEIVVECNWGGIVRLAADGRHILIETEQGQEKYLPEDCGTGNPPEKVYVGVFGALSPNEQYAADVHWIEDKANIVLRDLKAEGERIIGEGDFPAWSQDGQWLAYTGVDGLYIIQPNVVEAEPKRVVFLESPEPSVKVPVYRDYPPDQYYPPIVSWSSDGKWLVYHVYSNSSVNNDAENVAKYYSIYKVNVTTGETMKLLDGGYSPFWLWPVEEP